MTDLETKTDELLGKICESCHWPFVSSEDALAEKCDECEIVGDLEALIKAAKTEGVTQVLKIVAEEMLGKKEADKLEGIKVNTRKRGL